MDQRTINTKDAIDLFKKMLQPNSQKHILFLTGETRMGKTHLLGEVFPTLVSEKFNARFATIDLKSPAQTVLAILYNACEDLERNLFPSYCSASQARHSDPEIVFKNAYVKESTIHATITHKDTPNDFHRELFDLTTLFVNDLRRLKNQMIVFFVDHMDIESVSETTQTWMMHSFLKELVKVPHVRIVIAGISLPQIPTGYKFFCEEYQLFPVKKIEEYVTYCKSCDIKYQEETIEAIAVLSLHRPGFFVENMSRISFYKRGL